MTADFAPSSRSTLELALREAAALVGSCALLPFGARPTRARTPRERERRPHRPRRPQPRRPRLARSGSAVRGELARSADSQHGANVNTSVPIANQSAA